MKKQIAFNVPYHSANESDYLHQLLTQRQVASGGYYSQKSQGLLKEITGAQNALLTTSCTHALEMCALLLNIQAGDEVIIPSFTFVSAANAFVLRGAKIVFVDIRPDTLNIDENLLEKAITKKTKAILVMHYGGHSCDMETIMEISHAHRIPVIEDAAHCIGAYYQQKHLGTIGTFGTLSFHYTKNIHCGEGGALLINEDYYREKAEILRDKGTNRAAFLEGQIDKYSWVSIGSSYTLSELNAAVLYAQLEEYELVNIKRKELWNIYWNNLQLIGSDRLPGFAEHDQHNGHIFYILTDHLIQRQALQAYLLKAGVASYFHYVPLHASPAGQKYGCFIGEDQHTTSLSNRLLRLPLFYELTPNEVIYICMQVKQFYAQGQAAYPSDQT